MKRRPERGSDGPDLESVVVVVDDIHARGRRQQRGCLVTFGIWVGALILVFSLDQNTEAQKKWEWLISLSWGVIIFIAPAVGILQAVALKEYLDWKGKRTAGSVGFRLLIILGCWLSAAVVGLVGIFALAGAIEHASSWSLWKLIPGVALCLAVVALALFLLVLPFRRRSGMNEVEQRGAQERYLEQLRNPDFAGIEREAGVKLPELYKSLFAPGSEWLERQWVIYPGGLDDDEEAYDIEALMPAHPDALQDHESVAGRFLVFAEGDCDQYWIQLGMEDPPVYTHSTEDYASPDAFQKICDRLSIFLTWPKKEI